MLQVGQPPLPALAFRDFYLPVFFICTSGLTSDRIRRYSWSGPKDTLCFRIREQ
jgi:hypothetical protein